MIHQIKGQNKINLFDPIFIKNNKRKCRMIIENRMLPLESEYTIKDINKENLKVKLLLFIEERLNFSHMCNNIISLKKFYSASEKDIIPELEYDFIEEQKKIDDNFKNEKNEITSQIEKENLSNYESSENKTSSIFKYYRNNYFQIFDLSSIDKASSYINDILSYPKKHKNFRHI